MALNVDLLTLPRLVTDPDTMLLTPAVIKSPPTFSQNQTTNPKTKTGTTRTSLIGSVRSRSVLSLCSRCATQRRGERRGCAWGNEGRGSRRERVKGTTQKDNTLSKSFVGLRKQTDTADETVHTVGVDRVVHRNSSPSQAPGIHFAVVCKRIVHCVDDRRWWNSFKRVDPHQRVGVA